MRKTDLTDILLEKNTLTPEQLEEAKGEAKLTGTPLKKILQDRGWVSDEHLAQALAKQLDVPYVKLSSEKIDPQVARLIPETTARQYKAIAVKMEGEDLLVAFSSPLNLPAVDELKVLTGCGIKQMVATEKEINQAISKYYRVEETSKQALIDLRMQKAKEKKTTKDDKLSVVEDLGRVEDIPVVRLVNDVIQGAIRANASDIHLEPQDPEMIVRYRVDGILHDIMTIPKHVELGVVSRIKILGNMDITERRRPQDGHISIKQDSKEFDIRVSTVLAINGEKIVMRLLERSSMVLNLTQLGLGERDKKIMDTLVVKPYGMVLVTGPTGSGKTTTLNAVLSQMDSKRTNIVTIEQPVEYRLDRVTQIQVDLGAQVTFASGLRTVLRQDPDVIMVGEIRDKETAETAIQAALTGHLVFSTLHTNDAASAVTRLIDMGVEPFLISSTVIGTLAQRLARSICRECKEEYEPSQDELKVLSERGYLKDAKGLKLARGKGCDYCFQMGFRGRTAIFEIMKIDDTIRRMILQQKSSIEIKDQAVADGMVTLQKNAMQKVISGQSTLEEVERVVFVE